MQQDQNNVKTFQQCKAEINNLCGIAISRFFYSNNGPPPAPLSDSLRLLLPEADATYKKSLSAVIDAIEKACPIAEACPTAEVVNLATIAEKFNIPGYTWDRIIQEIIKSIAEIWLVRGLTDRNPDVITKAYSILNGDLTHLTDLTDLTSLTKFNDFLRNLTLFNACDDLASTDKKRFKGNLLGEIRQYVSENTGTFTTAELDRWLGITHSADKNVRRQACYLLLKNKEIRKDKRITGKYHILKNELNVIDLMQAEEAPFNVNLPLGLNDLVNIPTKSIIILAGTTNAGKTAFALETAKLNIAQKYPIYYLMSEMGPSEYKGRVLKVADDITAWNQRILGADVCAGFDGIITHHNPDGLTIVDFLEEIDGEYFKIASDIRGIYEALTTGVAFVCLQKHSKADVGRGGEATTEKPRLYLTMDVLHHQPRATITAIKIIKAKDFNGDNPNGKEIHVRVRAGSVMEPISDWMYCNQKQREGYIKRYQHMEDKGYTVMPEGEKAVVYRITLEDGTMGNILRRDVDKWQENMADIDVEKLLSWMEEKSRKSDMMFTKKSWFMQVVGILSKKQKQKQYEQSQPF